METGEEKDEALLVSGRVAFAEDFDDFLVTEPVGDGGACPETLSELSARDVESLDTLGYLIDRLVLVGGRKVGHLLEGHHLDLELVVVLDDKVLGIVGTVEVLALGVLSRTGVVTSDDEVCCAEVLTDDRVPDGFAGTSHAHGEREKGEMAEAVGVLLHDSLVDAHTGVVVNVSRLGKTDDGVDEDVCLSLASSTDRQFTVSTMHGVAGLESYDLPPCYLLEVGTELGRGVSEGNIVEVSGGLDSLDLSTNVEFLDLVTEVGDGRVGGVVGAENVDGLLNSVRGIDVLHCDNGEGLVISRVAECEARARGNFEGLDGLLGQVQVDGDWEKGTVGQSEILDDIYVVLLIQKSLERAESTIRDEFKVAELSICEGDIGECRCLLPQLSRDRFVPRNQILEDTTMGRVDHL